MRTALIAVEDVPEGGLWDSSVDSPSRVLTDSQAMPPKAGLSRWRSTRFPAWTTSSISTSGANRSASRDLTGANRPEPQFASSRPGIDTTSERDPLDGIWQSR